MVTIGATGTVSLDHGGFQGGEFLVPTGKTLAMSGGQSFGGDTIFSGSGTVEWSGDIHMGTTLLFGPGGNSLVLHDTNLLNLDGGLLSTQGAAVVVDGQVAVRGGGAWTNGASVAVVGNGAISAADESGTFQNNGVITTSGTQTAVLRGDGGATANFINNGSLVKASATDQQYVGFASTATGTVSATTGSLSVLGAQLGGQVQVASGASITLDSVTLNGGVSFSGAGTMAWQNYITLTGAVDIAASAFPTLSLGASTTINGQSNALTTRNLVVADGAQVNLLDQSAWNNYGTFSVGSGSTAALLPQGSGSFNNQAGGTIVLQGGATLGTNGADLRQQRHHQRQRHAQAMGGRQRRHAVQRRHGGARHEHRGRHLVRAGQLRPGQQRRAHRQAGQPGRRRVRPARCRWVRTARGYRAAPAAGRLRAGGRGVRGLRPGPRRQQQRRLRHGCRGARLVAERRDHAVRRLSDAGHLRSTRDGGSHTAASAAAPAPASGAASSRTDADAHAAALGGHLHHRAQFGALPGPVPADRIAAREACCSW